jgi:carbon monoxide dehydrogenase subunit G
MELVNDFTVNVPIEEAWRILTDVERIAPCLPGAQLQEIEGDTYRGVVKVKVGPIVAQFKGQAQFIERDEESHRAVLKAEGRDTGGKGNASARITAQLEPEASGTKVTVTTDLTITGKVAQFGRGALADVSTKLLKQFVEQLHQTVLNEPAAVNTTAAAAGATAGVVGGTPAAPATGAAVLPPDTEPAGVSGNGRDPAADSPGVRKVQQREAEPINLIDTAGSTLAIRIIPVGLVLVLAWLVLRRRRRHRES